jgi:LPS sulfotransferase NodH
MHDTVRRFEYSPLLTIINKLLSPLRKLRSVGGLSPLDIARTACRAEGRREPESAAQLPELFGEDYVTAIELCTEWALSAMGQIQWRAVLATSARARLQLDEYLRQGGPRAELQRPTFIVGLPRTGTTLLQYLLASAPGNRGLEFWELLSPIPKPNRLFDTKRRQLNGAFASALYRLVAPEYPTLHLTATHTLEECWYLFMPSFAVLNADFAMPLPNYGDWLLRKDMTPAYRRYRVLLEILQHQVGPRRLVLKCPDHLWFLDCLLQVFPEADVLWTHRDPSKTIPSYAAQVALPARQYMGQVDPLQLGQRLCHRFRQGIDRARAARERYPDARIVDVQFLELARDPVTTTCRALQALGCAPSAAHVAAMRDVLTAERPDGKARHRYAADTYGLSADQLRSDFADYLEHFGVSPEA